jgi:hypothetical protein
MNKVKTGVALPHLLQKIIGTASNYHTEKRKAKRKVKEVVITTVLAAVDDKWRERILSTTRTLGRLLF